MEIEKDKHSKHDAKRKDAARLPGTRLLDDAKAASMRSLYELGIENTKAEMIVLAAEFALANEVEFRVFAERKIVSK